MEASTRRYSCSPLTFLVMRNPVKVKPLRYPGQSITEQLNSKLEDLIAWIILPAYFVVMAGLEWWRYFWPREPVPWHLTAMAVVAIIISTVKIRKEIKTAKNYKLGRAGEQRVGQLLDAQRRPGAYVIHDVVFENFNIDHVIVCRQGVFAVETKAWSKPDSGRAVIKFDGKTLIKCGKGVGNQPLKQAERNARDLADLITERTGLKPDVQPVVVFPGWFIESLAGGYKAGNTWVLNENSLTKYIRELPTTITAEDAIRFNNALTDYVRSQAA